MTAADRQYRSATSEFQRQRTERERLHKIISDCVEHLEWSTPQGKAAWEAAMWELTSNNPEAKS